MKFLKLLLLIYIISNTQISFSQNNKMDTDIETIKHLGRDSIIQLALQKAQKGIPSKIEIKNFDKITVRANKKSIWVVFYNPIQYIPINSIHYYEISVEIIGGYISLGPIANPPDFKYNDKDITFYSPTEESERNIHFVLNANKNKSAAAIDKKDFIKNFDGRFTILENTNYYDVAISSTNYYSTYKVDKVSGKIYDEKGEQLAPPPKSEDELIEIKK